MSEILLINRQAQLTQLTLNRAGRANALNALLVEALHHAVDEAYRDGTRLLVLQGEGKHFCAGFDFSDLAEQSEADLIVRFIRIEQLLQKLFYAPFACVALAHGKIFGAGADLVISCATRWAAPETTFRMPGLRFGVVLGTQRLAQRIGAEKARAMLSTSETISTQKALSLGFIHNITPPDLWADSCAGLLLPSTKLSPTAYRDMTQALLLSSQDEDLSRLVRSVTAPGLKQRIEQYLLENQTKRAPT